MRQIDGGCHCGNIIYQLLWPVDIKNIPTRKCSCSFCLKHGAVYTSHREARLQAWVRDGSSVNRYTFGTHTAEFFICSRCGVIPFATSMIRDHLYAVVNVQTFEGENLQSSEQVVTTFDNETVESRLRRREQTWIPQVVIRDHIDYIDTDTKDE